MQKAGAEGALKTPNATPDALSPAHQVAPHGGRVVELFAGVGGFRHRAGARRLAGRARQPVGAEHEGSARLRLLRTALRRLRQLRTSTRTSPRCSTRSSDGERESARLRPAGWRLPLPGLLRRQAPHQAHGIQGKKGVLWWQIHRLIEMTAGRGSSSWRTWTGCSSHRPSQRGRDFAIMLASLSRPRLRGRVARRQRRRLRLPAATAAGLHRRRGTSTRPASLAVPRRSIALACWRARSRVVQPSVDDLFDGGSIPDLHLSGDLVASHAIVRPRAAASHRSRTAAS